MIKIDLKQILKEHANWKHPNFGIIAEFVSGLGEDGVVPYEFKGRQAEIEEENRKLKVDYKLMSFSWECQHKEIKELKVDLMRAKRKNWFSKIT